MAMAMVFDATGRGASAPDEMYAARALARRGAGLGLKEQAHAVLFCCCAAAGTAPDRSRRS
jgi:hypothetical protein